MFENIIEFSCQEDYFELGEDFPILAKANIPQWYKDLRHSLEDRTVKGCVPFLDTLTSGYILKIPQDIHLRHNVKDKEGKSFTEQWASASQVDEYLKEFSLHLNSGLSTHAPNQLGKCPYHEQNKNLSYHKIVNPWKIKTPPGYSCLFLPILNNQDDRFFPIPGIVDTDTYINMINFPIVINGYKYPVLETVLKKGTPYVQIFPFKREKWKMKLSKISTKKLKMEQVLFGLRILNNYKTRWWNKKSWK